MKIPRLTLLLLASFLLFGFVTQAGHEPLVEVVTDHYDFTAYEVRRIGYLLKVQARRRSFDIDFRFSTSRHYPSSHRYNRERDYADYTVHLHLREGYYDRCGYYREHYEWHVVGPYNRVIKRGHAHKFKHVAKDVVKAIYKDWH